MPDEKTIGKPEQAPFLRKREEEKRRKREAKERQEREEKERREKEERERAEKERQEKATREKEKAKDGPSTDDIMRDWPTGIPTPEQPKKNFERKKTPDILLDHPRNGKPLVKDYGDHIVVTRRALLGIGRRTQEKREQAVGVALQAAAERFGTPIHFEGNPIFLRETAKMAVKLGIPLEPGSKLGEQIYKAELERQRKEQERALKRNAFSQSLQKQKELEPKKELRKGLELTR